MKNKKTPKVYMVIPTFLAVLFSPILWYAYSVSTKNVTLLIFTLIFTCLMIFGVIWILMYVLSAGFYKEEKVAAREENKKQREIRKKNRAEKKFNLINRRRILKGKDSFEKEKKFDIGQMIAFAVMLAFAAVLFVLAGNKSNQILSYMPVEAVIISEQRMLYTDGRTSSAPVYEYYLDGIRYEYVDKVYGSKTTKVNGEILDSRGDIKIGISVTIYVNPENPADVVTVRESNFFYIGAFIALFCFYLAFIMSFVSPRLKHLLDNPAGLLGSTVFIYIGLILFLAPGLMTYATNFSEFFMVSIPLSIGAFVAIAFGIFGFTYELIKQIKKSRKNKKQL